MTQLDSTPAGGRKGPLAGVGPSNNAPALRGSATSFAALGLDPSILRALDGAGYEQPTPIQTAAIPPALAGRDVLGCARTGTGKTAAFALPILQHLLRGATKDHSRIRALVLAPTRELAAQIEHNLATYGRHGEHRSLVIFGGVSQIKQVQALRRGVDVLVATPGRLCDLMAQGSAQLAHVELFVLDEFDRMLDQGFLPAIRRIVGALPRKRQTLLFSATVPPELEALAQKLLCDPVRVSVNAQASTPERIDQAVCFVEPAGKRAALQHLLGNEEITRALVFTRTKHGANRVAEHLLRAGIEADAIHGNKSQNARERALLRFREGTLRVLVATDVAARGIDVDDVSHVINFDLPADPESYVHRIGRTGRAGRPGAALSLCTSEERGSLQRIERLIARPLSVLGHQPPANTVEPVLVAAGTAPAPTRKVVAEARPRRRRRY
jgi:ATP-dependent RNA helicase RhlE